MTTRSFFVIATVLGLGTPALTQTPSTQQPPVQPAPQATAPQLPPPTCPEMATALQALMRNDVRLRDWPQLARYREANRTVTPPAANESRVVFMGDSITDSWQQPRFGGFFPGKPYIDRGISGQTTPQMLIRFPPDAIHPKPK